MAQINRYTRRTPYEGELYQLPVELIAKTLDITQQRFDENQALAESIQDFVIPSLPQDRELANRLQTQYAKQVDDVVAEFSGDYSKATGKLRQLTRQIKKDFNPGGQSAAIIGNYNNYNTWLKNSQELVEKGKVLGEDLALANKYYLDSYKGIGEFNPVNGAYNIFQPETLSEYADLESIVQDTYKTFKPEKRKVGKTIFANGQQIYTEVEEEGILAGRLQPSFYQAIATDPKAQGYLRQRARFTGATPKDVEDYVQSFSAQRAKDLSYINSTGITKAERDPLALLRERARLAEAADIRKEARKEARENQASSNYNSLYKWEPTIQAPMRKESTLDPDNWRASSGTTASFIGVPAGGGLSLANIQSKNNVASGKPLLDVLFKQDFVKDKGIDTELAKTIWKDLSTKNPRAYVDNYGSNTAWTEEFDRNFIKEYKKEEKNFSRLAASSLEIPSPVARQNALNMIAGRLVNPENVQVMEVGSNVAKSAEAANLSREDLMDDKGKLLGNDISVVQPGPGFGASGFLIHTKKGSFIVVDENIERQAYNAELASALNPIFFEGYNISPNTIRTRSEAIRNPETGQVEIRDVEAFVERRIVSDGNTRQEMLFEVPSRLNEAGRKVPDYTKQANPINLQTLQQNYQAGVSQLLGTGQTKAQATFFDFYNFLNENE